MDKSNKYLFTIRSLTGGGAERVVATLASRMAEDGYDVSIIAYGKSDQDYAIDPKVKIYYMPEAKDSLWGKISRIGAMDDLVGQIQPDVIIPFVGTVLYVSYLVARKRKIPFVRTVRNSPWVEGGGYIDKKIRDHLNYKAAAIMVQNQEQVDYFPESMREKIAVVPNPISESFVNTKKETYSDEIRKIVTAGRLMPQKDHAFLIKVFSRIHESYRDVKLDIYGEGNEAERLKKLIIEFKLGECCFLKGRNNNIVDALKEADLFVMTSKFEGMPNALMEAMCTGLPCISSDCQTGPRTLIDDRQNGLLYKTGDEDDLFEKMEYALQNTNKMAAMGMQARKCIIDNYAYDVIYKDLLKLLTII